MQGFHCPKASDWENEERGQKYGTDARIRGNEYYSTKNGVIYTIYLKRLRAGRKNAVFLWQRQVTD